jgi:hypothetical protein
VHTTTTQSYHGLHEFAKDWLLPGEHTLADDVPFMWQAVIRNKMVEQGAKDDSALWSVPLCMLAYSAHIMPQWGDSRAPR